MKKNDKGFFVSFEGIDGCGKSTQLELLHQALKKSRIDTIVTREPGGTNLAEAIRAIILKDKSVIDNRTELLLYLASRSQNVSEKILPALLEGKIVLCDRFSDSTLAYQGGGRGLPYSEIQKLDDFACSGLKPDLTFLFDLPAAQAVMRINKSGRKKDRMEKEGEVFLDKVRRAYLKFAKAAPERFVVINALRGVDEVASEVLGIWNSRVERDFRCQGA